MKKTIVYAFLLIMALGITGCVSDKKDSQIRSFDDLDKVPAFACKDLNGNDISNDIFASSKLTLVNIWSTECSPCIKEIPELQEIYKDMKDQDVNVVGIVADGMGKETNALQIVHQQRVAYINIVPNQKFMDDFVGLTPVVPVTLLVNNKGELVGKQVVGAQSKETFQELIKMNL